WARLKHPELIAGALASSAPLIAQMDFYGYLQRVEEQFQQHSRLCYQQLYEGFNTARILLQWPGKREELTKVFNITPPLSDFDVISKNDIDLLFQHLIVREIAIFERT
ncbi:hypothetical protein PFISCL1PPCAC_13274, partial [Pristionchus fissidentatus]